MRAFLLFECGTELYILPRYEQIFVSGSVSSIFILTVLLRKSPLHHLRIFVGILEKG